MKEVSFSSLQTDNPDRSVGCIPEKRHGLKKNCGGNHKALSKHFDKPIQDIVKTITEEEFASCTKAQQEYIIKRRKEEGSCSQEKLDDVRNHFPTIM